MAQGWPQKKDYSNINKALSANPYIFVKYEWNIAMFVYFNKNTNSLFRTIQFILLVVTSTCLINIFFYKKKVTVF